MEMNFISQYHEQAWNSALKVLHPSKSQLEHGLELHKNLFAMDHFGFLPSGRYDHDLVEKWNQIKERYVGQEQLSWRFFLAKFDEFLTNEEAQSDFRRALIASGLNCMVQTVAEGKSRAEDIHRMAGNFQLLRIFSDLIVQVTNSKELKAANAAGKIAVLWSVNGPPIAGKLISAEEELEWVETWRRLGVKLMHLSYNRRNFIADGCAEPANAGLSELGHELIACMNKNGIIVDVPHTGLRSSIEAAKVSSKPIMATHTAARALFDFIRCKDDETLRAIAATDGLVGVYAYNGMLGGSDDLAQMLNHIEYIAKLIGVEHVGIGTDLQYQREWPQEVYDMRSYPNAEFSSQWWGDWDKHPDQLTKPKESTNGSLAWINWPLYTVGLVTRGFSDDDIAKILGQNFLRVLDANQKD